MFVRHGHWSAVDMERNVRLHRDEMLGPDAGRTWYRGAAGVNGCDHAVFLCPRDQGYVIKRRFDGAETRLGQPDTLRRHLLEIFFSQAGLEDDRSGIHTHSARPIILIALECSKSECLHSLRICGPARHMNFGRRDCGRDAAVGVALEKSDGLLTRCVIAKRVVYLGIDQSGNGNGAVGIDNDIAVFSGFAGDTPNLNDFSSVHHDRIAPGDGILPLAIHDRPEINDCGFHRSPSSPLISSKVSPPTRAFRRPRLATQMITAISSGSGAS